MFDKPTKIIGYKNLLDHGIFVTPEYIISEKFDLTRVSLMKRYCPHRQYPIGKSGQFLKELYCEFHGLKWNSDGSPQEHPYKLSCGLADISNSGLIGINYIEPDAQWVHRISQEKNLQYSYSTFGSSNIGSWLWLMEAEADYMHVKQREIHPDLSQIIDLRHVNMYEGDNWIAQEHSPGWTSIFIYPYTFVEHTTGCLSINFVVPADHTSEFGFEWMTQFYFDPTVSKQQQDDFASLDKVFREDVATIEKVKGPYYPLKFAMNELERHSLHWSKWVLANRKIK